MRLSRKVEYALMAIKVMSQDEELQRITSAKELSDQLGCSFEALAKVMQVLAQAHWVSSVTGVKGGYRIEKAARYATLYDLMELFEGPLAVTKCLEHGGDCDLLRSCQIHASMQALNQRIVQFYKSLRLQEVVS